MHRSLIAFCASALLSACASMTNPYVLPYEGAKRGGSTQWDCAAPSHDAVCTIRRLQGNLARNLREHTQFGAISGSLLLPLAGLVAYKGATGGGSHNIAALSSAGFTGYGVTQYLYKRPRELIYVSGISALDCAIDLALPYLWARAERSDIEGDSAAIEDLRRLASELDQHLAKRSTSNAVRLGWNGIEKTAQGEILSLTRVLEPEIELAQARLILSDARHAERIALSEQVAAELIGSGYRIIGLVNQQLAFLAPDLAKLQSELSGLKLPTPPAATVEPAQAPPPQPLASLHRLGEIGAQVTAGLDARLNSMAAKGNDRTQQERDLEAAIPAAKEWVNTLNFLVSSMAMQLDTVRRRVAAAEARQPPPLTPPTEADWEKCGVEPPDARFEVKIALDKPTLALVAGKSATILASGGSGTPVVKMVFGPPTEHQAALTIAPSDYVSGVARLTVASTDALPPGTYVIAIDNATLRVDVTKAAAP